MRSTGARLRAAIHRQQHGARAAVRGRAVRLVRLRYGLPHHRDREPARQHKQHRPVAEEQRASATESVGVLMRERARSEGGGGGCCGSNNAE